MSNGENPGGFPAPHAPPPPDSGPMRSLRFARDLHVRGRLNEAERAYRETLEAEPDRADALHLLGVLTAQRGDYPSAVSLIIRAAGLDPSDAAIPCNLGNALRDSGRLEDSLVAYGRALKLDPLHASTLKNRGGVLVRLGRFAEALADCDRALPFGPEDATLHTTRGHALAGLGRHDDAAASYTSALALKPANADALTGRGRALTVLQRTNEALADSEKALVLAPDNAEALAGYAKLLLLRAGRHKDALAVFDKALAKTPEDAEALRGRADALFALDRGEEAAAAYDQAFARNPTLAHLEGARLLAKRAICDWADIAAEQARLVRHVAAGNPASDPFAFLMADAGPREQLLCAQNYAAAKYPARAAFGNAAYRHDKIRLGYVAGDFSESLAAPLFAGHDKSAFALHAYATLPGDGVNRAAAFDSFYNVANIGDREIAERIRAAEIDILIDLEGYAPAGRPGIFACKPSPVQVAYLGFPGTSGAPAMDYILADGFVIPKESRGYYSEKIVTLPECYQASEANRPVGRVPLRGELGLPRYGFVFAAFGDCHRITPEMFDIWMRLIVGVPNSALWLKDCDAAAQRNLAAEAAKRGVAPERLVFAPSVPGADHRARLALADLILDTQPFGGHDTTGDALCAGVPVLTCPGRSFASRAAASLNHAARLDEMVAGSLAEYEALALKFARKPLLLAAIRKKLAANRKTYPLFDTARLTRHLEAAYRIMWERRMRGEAPGHFAIGPDGSRV